jgi:pimeloyl-ACP methyl ester carboxylesterase
MLVLFFLSGWVFFFVRVLYYSALCERNPSVNNNDFVRIYAYRNPYEHSKKNTRHWGQIARANKFQRYDYGEEKNKEVYGHPEPPLIDISKIRDIPIAIMVGKYDKISPPKDGEWIKSQLSSDDVKLYKVYDYGHLSFLMGKDMNYVQDIDQILKLYSR